jgi:hypothetical protein
VSRPGGAMIRWLLLVAVVAGMLVGLSGCNKSEESGPSKAASPRKMPQPGGK